ncbi:DUF1631 family protein [Pseudomonas sp. CGJS7]|uniref:DUF1631 family protein n=1 Tax=Pseudomonas sp. CGJS7 TaxID=3109348 RepID=UPI00300AC109
MASLRRNYRGKIMSVGANPFAKGNDDPQMLLILAQGVALPHLSGVLRLALQRADVHWVQKKLGGAELAAVRELGRAQDRIVQRFGERVVSGFERLQGGTGAMPIAGMQLGQVSDDSLVEQMTAQEMIERLTKANQPALGQLGQRLARLAGRDRLQPQEYPCHPQFIVEALNASLVGLPVTIDALVVVYRCLEQELAGGLRPLCDRLNTDLGAAGVLGS